MSKLDGVLKRMRAILSILARKVAMEKKIGSRRAGPSTGARGGGSGASGRRKPRVPGRRAAEALSRLVSQIHDGFMAEEQD